MTSDRLLLVTCLLVPTLTGSSPAADVDRYGDPLPPGAVARLGTTRLGDWGVLQAIAYSPDGKTLAFPGSDTISLLDVRTGNFVRGLGRPKPFAECAAQSTDGTVVAS